MLASPKCPPMTLPSTKRSSSPQCAALTDVLDETRDRILAGDGHDATAELSEFLDSIFVDASSETQAELVAQCREHAIHAVLLEDPYTARAFQKPRGYAGDAVVLDYIYSGLAPDDIGPQAAEVFRATTGCSASRSVAARRDRLSELIDQAAVDRSNPNVLAVASGH